MSDEKKTPEQRRQELIQESNRAFDRGDFKTSHEIDRNLKIAAKITPEWVRDYVDRVTKDEK